MRSMGAIMYSFAGACNPLISKIFRIGIKGLQVGFTP
jgi:hypothetical protein